MELVNDFGIWRIVAHIGFKFYSGAAGTFSTASTPRLTSRGLASGSEDLCQAVC